MIAAGVIKEVERSQVNVCNDTKSSTTFHAPIGYRKRHTLRNIFVPEKQIDSNNGGPMSVNARVQKHRDKLKGFRRRRLDLHLPKDLVEAADTFAKQHRRYIRDIVGYALEDYLRRHGVVLTGTQRR